MATNEEQLPPLGLHKLCKDAILLDMVDVATGGVDGICSENKVLVTDALARAVLQRTVVRSELSLVRAALNPAPSQRLSGSKRWQPWLQHLSDRGSS